MFRVNKQVQKDRFVLSGTKGILLEKKHINKANSQKFIKNYTSEI